MKRYLTVMIALLCMLAVFSGCGSKEAAAPEVTEAPAEATAAPTAAPTATPEPTPVPVEWAELEPEMGILTVRLPIVADSYYSWTWEISDPNAVEFLTSSTEGGEYTASFRGIGSGECAVSFRYSCADALAETRQLTVQVTDAKVAAILSGEATVVEGVREDVLQPEIMEMRAANRVDAVLAAYDSLSVVSETWEIVEEEEVWAEMNVKQFSDANGVLTFNDESTYYPSGDLYASYLENTGFPSLFCTYDSIKDEASLLLMDAESGREMVSGLWLNHGVDCRETIVSIDDNSDYNVRVMTTRWENEATGYGDEYVYFIDMDTGLVTGMEHWIYDIATGTKLYVTRTNVFYDDYRTLDPLGMQSVIDTNDSCTTILVIDPGQSTEHTGTISVKRHAEMVWHSQQEYKLYADAECTQEITVVDTSVDMVTLYAAKAN